ncbi:MAG: DNA-binding protein [Prevotella sp.]|nr:DNA-binding protein [Prevotella sp.]
MKKTFLILIAVLCSHLVSATDTTKPWTFWYWMYGCVSDEGIRLDLQAMHDAGIGGFYLMPIKDVSDGPQYEGTARQLSAEWWKRMDTVFHVADSLGLEMGIHLSDGFALGGGPWITPEESMQRVVWSDTVVNCKNGHNVVTLPQPTTSEGYYEDIATYAISLTEQPDDRKPQASVEFPFRSTDPCDIIFTYDTPFTLRHLRIITGGNNYQAHRWQVYASDDGVSYQHVRDIEPARQGWQNTDAYATYATPATRARYFKLHWTPEGSDPGSEDMDAAKWRPVLKVTDIVLGSEPVIDGYEGKSGAVWRVSKAFPITDADCIPLDKMIRLSGVDGQITIPKGNWRILRMGHTSTGHTNATGGGGRGLECDKFSREAIQKQLTHWFGAIHERAPRQVLRRLHVDSWECGSQNWSKTFANEFQKRRGYDLLTWLPVYAGLPMESSAKTEQVLRDIRQTIAELIDEVFFDEIEQATKRYGVELSTECVAPTMVSDGLLHYRHADYPMGEFWLNSPTHDKPNDMLDAISGAHIYGKNIIQAEGFTEVRGTWDETPALLKPLLDRNYCLGINSIVFHVYTHNPWTDRRPGMTLDGIGTFFQRDNTWWREMPVFTQYIQRCQQFLQRGMPVVDLAVYIGDEVPRRAILPERLTDILPGLLGDSILQREAVRLRNEGQPMETSPVGVSHTRNMTKAEDWINPLHGYHYDSFNHDVLNGMSVENGNIVTRDGMTYAAIVVPSARKMNPNNINTGKEKLEQLRRQGARIIEQPWTETDLLSIGVQPDVVLPPGVDYTHRHTVDEDIYFFSNQTALPVTFSPQCRAQRTHGYWYNPVTDETLDDEDAITLAPWGSVFYRLTDQVMTTSLPADSTNSGITTFDQPWHLIFEENGLEADTPLMGWEQMEDPKMRYYSGHVSYTNTFKYRGKDKEAWLYLGEVHDIATVYVNGICCGTVWTEPYGLDITHALRKGKNEIRIEVVNTWANALRGADEGKPPYDGIWTNGKYRRAEKELLPAGLIGPVFIIYGIK